LLFTLKQNVYFFKKISPKREEDTNQPAQTPTSSTTPSPLLHQNPCVLFVPPSLHCCIPIPLLGKESDYKSMARLRGA
jgi:hypothetical protein